MMHINQMVSELKVPLEDIRVCCELLELKIDGALLSPETVTALRNIKSIAESGGITLIEAARELKNIRNNEHVTGRFDKREYIKQRFGQDPELAPQGSFIRLIYEDVATKSDQLAKIRHQTIFEASTLALEDLLMNGVDADEDWKQAHGRVTSSITDFLGNVNWGAPLPQLSGTLSTPPTKQLTAVVEKEAPQQTSQKMPSSSKKSQEK